MGTMACYYCNYVGNTISGRCYSCGRELKQRRVDKQGRYVKNEIRI